jgi:hypothetical protein
MTHSILVERTIWTAKCPNCHEQIECESHPPKERYCVKCSLWIPYIKHTFVGPPLSRFGKE